MQLLLNDKMSSLVQIPQLFLIPNVLQVWGHSSAYLFTAASVPLTRWMLKSFTVCVTMVNISLFLRVFSGQHQIFNVLRCRKNGGGRFKRLLFKLLGCLRHYWCLFFMQKRPRIPRAVLPLSRASRISDFPDSLNAQSMSNLG